MRTTTYPDGSFEQLEYDDHSLVASRDRAGRWTRHRYNALTKKVQSDGTFSTYAYDFSGRLLSEVDPMGRTLSYQYAIDDRITKKDY